MANAVRWPCLLAIGITGCFAPRSFEPCTVTCAETADCPGDLACNNGLCANEGAECSPVSMVCFGSTDGLVGEVCFRSPLPPFAATQKIDTGAGSQDCTVPTTGGPDVCFVAAQQITIDRAVTVRGSRPLVLWSATSIEVTANGRIDAASHRGETATGPGANALPCGSVDGEDLPGTPPVGAGGCGGAFGTTSGAGGAARQGGTTVASNCTPATVTFTELRGGCRGGNGGLATNGGSSGGAVYLMARDEITVRGQINASGAAGDVAVALTDLQGGGGGGSGGVIGFETETLTFDNAMLLAVGGGGSSGATSGANGHPGNEARLEGPFVVQGTLATVPTNFGGGTNLTGGASGGGVTIGNTAGGGGGGGGHGYIRTYPPQLTHTGSVTAIPGL